MRMKHTVKLKSGDQVVYEFNTKAESDKALRNAAVLQKSFGNIQCVWVEPIGHPEKRERIDFKV